MDAEQVFNIFYFGSGMSLKGQERICFTHSISIISHLDKGFTSVINNQADFSSLRINGILKQLLYRTGRTLNDLSSGDLVGNVIRKQMDNVWQKDSSCFEIRKKCTI
jgi:hypothetical protein